MHSPFEMLMAVESDFQSLGLPVNSTLSTPEDISYGNLYQLALATQKIGHSERRFSDLSDLKSGLGKRLGQLIIDGIVFNKPGRRNRLHGCCKESEIKLYDSLKEQTSGVPSMIVTSQSVPVAFIKTGDLTAYGLADLPEFGIFSGVFSSIQKAFTLHRKKANGINNPPHSVDISFCVGASPLRIGLSAFAPEILELAKRQTPLAYGMLEHRHAKIENMVTQLHEKAIKLTNEQAEEYYGVCGLSWPIAEQTTLSTQASSQLEITQMNLRKLPLGV